MYGGKSDLVEREGVGLYASVKHGKCGLGILSRITRPTSQTLGVTGCIPVAGRELKTTSVK